MNRRHHSHAKSKIIAAVLAFLLPGAGNLYTGQQMKGLMIMLAFFIDVAAVIRLANTDGGRYLLIIVYLVMLLPVIYFISVYSALQGTDPEEGSQESIGLTQGLLLTAGGMLMLLFIQLPRLSAPWLYSTFDWSAGALLSAGGCTVLFLMWKGISVMYRAGRVTAALLIITAGTLLLSDKIQGKNHIALLAQWWPLLVIALGIESIVYSLLAKRSGKALRIDMLSMLSSLILAGTAFVVTQYSDFPARWLDEFNVDISQIAEYDEEKGFQYEKPLLKAPLDDALELITITNINGHIAIRTGDVQEAVIRTVIWVDTPDKGEADRIADQSFIQITPGPQLGLEAKGQAYGANNAQMARMNIELTLPSSMAHVIPTPEKSVEEAADQLLETDAENNAEGEETETSSIPIIADPIPLQMKIDVGLGDVSISDLQLAGGLNIRSSSGLVKVERVTGPVIVKSKNGSIEAKEIYGTGGSFEARNGSIALSELGGDVYVSTLNGTLELLGVLGSVEAETRNGEILIDEPMGAVKADTLNGNIVLSSSVVAGDWDLGSSIGEIRISMPEFGDYRFYGSVTFGKINSELPFHISKKIVRAQSGAGTHRIQINANNNIHITRHRS